MVKWILSAVGSLMISNVIKVHWDLNNAKDVIEMLQAAAKDGVLTNVEVGFILMKIAEDM